MSTISDLLQSHWALPALLSAPVLLVWLYLCIWGPSTFRRKLSGRNARNWPGVIFLGKGIARPAAVYAQEAYEAQHKLNPINLFLVMFSRSAKRRMEYMGHEIEVQVCARLYSQTAHDARMREAETMQRGYSGLFRRMTVPEIYERMASRSGDARDWVDAHIEQIRGYK